MPDDLLRQRCAERIEALPIPRPFVLERFRQNLERQRGRSLRLVPGDMPPGHTGLWIPAGRADYIFYQQDTPYPSRLRTIVHQVAHMTFGHRGVPVSEDALSRLLFPHLDPHLVRKVLLLSAYTDAEEQEAEVFAFLLLERFRG